MVRVTSVLIIAASALGFSFRVEGSDRDENMVRCRHECAKSSLKRIEFK